MASPRRKQSAVKRKAPPSPGKVSTLPVSLWTTCTFTFVSPRPASDVEPPPKVKDLNPVYLPQELIDYILDFLHDDARSLIVCSLVSRSFASGSRFHLFGTFNVKDEGTLCGLLDVSPCATACSAIRTLCLGNASVLSKNSPLKVPFSSLEGLIAHLPILSNFYMLNILVDFAGSTHKPSISTSEVRSAKAIRYLWLYKVIDATTRRPLQPHEFFPLLRLFSTIETLNYSCGFEKRPSFIAADDSTLQPEGALLPFLEIQSLKFCSSQAAAPLMQAVRRTSSAQSLRSVEVCAQDRETLIALGELLRDVRLYISELTVDCRRRNSLHILKDANTMIQALDIIHNLQDASALQTVNFKLHMSHDDIPLLEWHWQFTLGFINEVAKVAPNIASCTFIVTLAGYYPLKTLETANWQTLDKALKQLPNLRSIRIGARNSSPFDWTKADQKKTNQALHDVFANMLPEWKAKGALSALEQ
ncbi:hypothetical protein BDY19DRAFT_956574 [Irpex rosettiformis]|uniref:Uncharacterized protein n=1 Tax=Irpex rosettiformis TaxID=378272 RepID=A0ACB8TYX2_9APHY|nr:hypothetical protein BDY19DRAFT_956574 [Irpex rosettiformis]